MPRLTRPKATSTTQQQDVDYPIEATEPSHPKKALKRTKASRPRDSDVSSIMTADDEDGDQDADSYTPQPKSRPMNSRDKSGQMLAGRRVSLQKQALHNARRSMSGTHTPRHISLRDDSSVPSNLQVVGTALTPASKRPVPILSNFEDWLKLATDNKINATNSWNFALIDYFHEMSLLRDENGRGINFQKASCTLDGCVKIYVGRVESVGVEAGRLLSGLASSATDSDETSKKKRRTNEEDEEEEDQDESDGEGGTQKKERKKKQRSHEATLAPSFASLQLKKLELEFAVDPLFKKASADFDEGGAKGLLLNHLCINEEGKIVFDSSDDTGNEKQPSVNCAEEDASYNNEIHAASSPVEKQSESPDLVTEDVFDEEKEIDLAALANKFIPDLALLDGLDICPSMKCFKLGDPTAALSIPLLHGDEWRSKQKTSDQPPQPDRIGDLDLAEQSGLFIDGSNGLEFDDDEADFGGFDIGEEVGFGQGGEVWAREAAVEPMMRPVGADDDEQGQIEGDGEGYIVSMQHRYREDAEQETMLAFFGKAFNTRAKVGSKAFETITNWRIQKIQKQTGETQPSTRQRKEKEPFEIDFLGPRSDNLKKLLNEKPVSNDKISLPKTQIKTKGKNLLDKDDEMINVKALLRLWSKPKCRVTKKKGGIAVVDEGFGARGREQPKTDYGIDDDEDDVDAPHGDYDANFFADDEPLAPMFDGLLPIDDDDDNDGDQPGFVDAREMLSPPPDEFGNPPSMDEVLSHQVDHLEPQEMFPTASQPNMLPGSFGSQLVTQQGRRLRPEYVNYARTAKKVDVRALKENMWKGMMTRLDVFSAPDPARIPTPALTDSDGDTDMMDANMEDPFVSEPKQVETTEDKLKFTQILGGLKEVYPDQQMKDISTSYGFICLLHLANEKGLLLEGGREDGTMNEILVRRDPGVDDGYVGE